MEKPGSRLKFEETHLIIEQSEQLSRTRRVLTQLITAVAWLIWLVCWIPVMVGIMSYIGIKAPAFLPSNQAADAALMVLTNRFPAILGLMVVIFLVNKLALTVFSRDRTISAEERAVSERRIASRHMLAHPDLVNWRHTQILTAEHDAQGRLIDVLPQT